MEPWVCSPFLRHLVFGVKDNAPSVVHLLVCLQYILLYWNILLFLMIRFYVPSLSRTLCRFRWQAVQGGRAADHAEGQPVAGLPVWRTEGASGPARPAGSDGGHGAVKQWVNSYLPMWKRLGLSARHRSLSHVPVTVLKKNEKQGCSGRGFMNISFRLQNSKYYSGASLRNLCY